MAINPGVEFPGRITAPNANYPYGSSKDESSPGAGDGTPYVLARANDIFGFQQALLSTTGLVPTGNADTVLASQYQQGLNILIGGLATTYIDTGATDAYVIDLPSNVESPGALFDGMEASFYAVNPNTGASTINVGGTGGLPLENEDLTPLSADFIQTGILNKIKYNSPAARWFVIRSAGTEPKLKAPHEETKTATGTSIDFTSIPVGARKITVSFDGVSTNGTSRPIIQIGDAGGIEISGYDSSAQVSGTEVGFTDGLGLVSAMVASIVFSGDASMTLNNPATNTWTFGWSGANTRIAPATYQAGGNKSISAELDRIRITTQGGANIFDAGSVKIRVEF